MTNYFAYGMNLNHAHMHRLCPTAKPIGAKKIHGFRLVMRRFADIVEADQEEFLWGGVWEISKADEEILDIFEGVPNFYKKTYIDDMLTYQMTEAHQIPGVPSEKYLETIRKGLTDFGLKPETLEQNLDPNILWVSAKMR